MIMYHVLTVGEHICLAEVAVLLQVRVERRLSKALALAHREDVLAAAPLAEHAPLTHKEDRVSHLALPHDVLAAVELERGDDAGEPPELRLLGLGLGLGLGLRLGLGLGG